MEFHIARSLRERLKLDEVLFSYTGNAIFANVAAARKLALGLNELRGQTADTAQSVHGADLLFIHIEPDSEERLDLVAGYQPVMNVATAYEE